MVHSVWPYLGSLGRLIEVPFTASESVSRESRYSEEFTVEGRRRVQVRPASPRSWDVSMPLSMGAEAGALSAFTSGAWGNGPWHWIPVQAHQGNLLTPREAQLLDRASVSGLNVQDAGPVRDASGAWSPRSVTVTLTSGWVALMRGVPVVAGLPFTFSCDVEGSSPQLHVQFMDAAGGTVGTQIQAGAGTAMQRVSVSSVVPAGAVEAYVGLRSTVTRATRPQVSWTAAPVPFSAGHGCRSAVVDGLSEDLVVANRCGTYSSVGFTVMEVA